ncbi:UPF0104 family protein [bacterium]|nr:UPF0104 family protein [bacterium]
MTGTSETPERRGLPVRRIVQAIISIAVVVGIFVGIMPQIADYGEVWTTIRSMTGIEIVTLLAAGLWNLVTYWFVLVAVLPGLTYPQAAVANQASTAISNSLPGGGALGVGVTYAMYSSWGFTGADTTRSIVVSGIWNNFIKLGLPILVLPLLAFQEDVDTAWIVASMVGVIVLAAVIIGFWLMLRSDRLAARVGTLAERAASALRRLIRRPPVTGWDERAKKFRGETSGLLSQRWFRLTISAIVSHVSLYVVLLVALRHVGVSESEVSWVRVLAAFAFVRLISALPITPGGLGVVELGYTAALSIGVDEITRAQIVAAILVFRFITFFLPIPLGATSYVIWRRNKSWRKRAPDAEEPPGSQSPVEPVEFGEVSGS